MTAALAFSRLAPEYDELFTDLALGRRLRARVWRALDRIFPAGARVLDIGCGTGADAMHMAERGVSVVGIDVAPGMIQVARAKARGLDSATPPVFHVLAAEDAAELASNTGSSGGRFDGFVANFGVANCFADPAAVGGALARLAAPGAKAVFVVMPPWCWWEPALAIVTARPRRATRRLVGRPAQIAGSRLYVTYVAPHALATRLGRAFRLRRVAPLGALLPPSDCGAFLETRPHLLALLERLEERVSGFAWAAPLADHFVAEMDVEPKP